jgi:kynurenine formamidase
MNTQEQLLEYINSLTIIDTHEHLPLEKDRPPKADVLSEWLTHYFSCDLVSAGISDADLAKARDSSQDLAKRWKLVEPYWQAAQSTGYGRALALSARDLYGIDAINGATLGALNKAFCAARSKGGHYDYVLRKKSRIALSIVDAPLAVASDPHFVAALRIDHLISPSHVNQLRAHGAEVGVKVHTLEDWEEVSRRQIEKGFQPGSRVVCLKTGEAYLRSLRFDKAARADAERAFNELFADRNLPEWRAGIKPAPALENHMMHFICRLADARGLPFQIHTGLQEGNGNIIYDANPTLLSNLFLEYREVRFDIFHMGYPYTQELSNLAKNFRNVHIDMCWGHIISPEAARRALVEWLDAVPANKISAFGGDYCFVDGVYGHQHLARQNVALALASKVADGSFDLERAQEIAGWLFVANPIRIFGLEKLVAGKVEKKPTPSPSKEVR